MNNYIINFNVRIPNTYPASVVIDANSKEEAMKMFKEACHKANNEVCCLPFKADICFNDLEKECEVALDCEIEVEE